MTKKLSVTCSCLRRSISESWLKGLQQQHVLLAVLLFGLLTTTPAAAVRTRAWDDDNSWNNNNNNNWNTDSSWNGGQSWSSTRQPGTNDRAADIPGPPTGPILVKDNGGMSVKNSHRPRVKDTGPHPGFSGGFLRRQLRCSNPNLPGCQSCVGDICTSCYEDYGDASFSLSVDTRQCVCPPGYGRIAEEDLPDWWSGRRLMQSPAAPDSNSTSNVSNSTEAEGHQKVTTMGLTPPPPWATDCLPCPVNFYSPGGAIGFAQCKVCPDGWTTANATAASDCIAPYCQAGQEVNFRTGRCRQCPFGTYRPAKSSSFNCTVCPVGLTTPSRGATSLADCRVPICTPGTQLNIDLFTCQNCTGNTISPGGVRANGPYQPFCQECPTFTAAVNRTVCIDDACPSPDAFSIVCRQDQLPSCGPGSKPFRLEDYCTAYPLGAQLQWVRATIDKDSLSNVTSYGGGLSNNFTTPAVAYCPAGANGTNVWWPFITSFKGRTNCFCTADTSCRFLTAGQSSADTTFKVTNLNAAINLTIHDPQLTSMRALLRSMTGKQNYTKFGQRLGSYCLPDSTWSNGLSTSCIGPYLFNFTYAPAPITNESMLNGTLPSATYLQGLSHLQELVCAGCGLRGQLPDDWGTSNALLALKKLDLGSNMFTGTLPVSWGGLLNLYNLTLSSAPGDLGYIGNVPSFWGNMRSLGYANFSNLYVNTASCLPKEWSTRNGLVPGTTLFTNANQPFCNL